VKHEACLMNGDYVSFDTVSYDLEVKGCSKLRRKVTELKMLSSDPSHWPHSTEGDHVSLLINQLRAKAIGTWVLPYAQQEICHCRQVETRVVEELIILGAHSQQEISQRCRAGTGCGTCRTEIKKLIRFYR